MFLPMGLEAIMHASRREVLAQTVHWFVGYSQHLCRYKRMHIDMHWGIES